MDDAAEIARKRAMAVEQQQAQDDARAVLDSDAAMRFVCRVLDVCNYHGDPFVAGSADRTAHNAGRRRAALDIVDALAVADKNAHLRIMQVARAEQARRENNASEKIEGTNDEE